jgi:prevent-host-death family protein
MVIVRKTSLAYAKAHLSAIVDAVEHRGKSMLILRHGKPAAAIVPVDLAQPAKATRKVSPSKTTRPSVRRFIEEFSAAAPTVSAVEDLRRGRR